MKTVKGQICMKTVKGQIDLCDYCYGPDLYEDCCKQAFLDMKNVKCHIILDMKTVKGQIVKGQINMKNAKGQLYMKLGLWSDQYELLWTRSV